MFCLGVKGRVRVFKMGIEDLIECMRMGILKGYGESWVVFCWYGDSGFILLDMWRGEFILVIDRVRGRVWKYSRSKRGNRIFYSEEVFEILG